MKHTTIVSNIMNGTYKKYLPSRKVASIIGATLAIFIIFFAVRSARTVSYNSKNGLVLTVGDAVVQDSDGDGVPDWEERLWGTNPKNPDTDGDGVPDGTEIASRKDALALANGYASSSNSLNETDKFARELFVTYSALSEQGKLSDDASANLAQAAITKTASSMPVVVTHTSTDLKIIPDTKGSNLIYRKAVTELSQVGGGKLGTEFALINQGIQQNDPDALREASKVARVYNMYETSLLKMPVPSNQVQNHVRLINDIAYISSVLPQMESLESDVIKGVSLYTVYTKAYQDMFGAFEAIGKTQ